MFGFVKKIFKRNDEKQYGLAITDYDGIAVWPKRDYENFAKETYLKNLISFRCIDMISKSIRSLDWYIYKKTDKGREKIQHELSQLLIRANPRLSWHQLTYDVMAYLLIAGNAYISRIAPNTGPNKGKAKELYVLRPDLVKINVNPNTKEIISYVYKADSISENQVFEVNPITGECDLLHIKFFHPTDAYYGASIVEAAAREIDTNNSAIEWHMNLLQKQARPGLMLIYERMLGEEHYKRIKKDIKENTGAENAGGTLILDAIKDAKPYGWTPTEMDFIEGNRDKARMIAAAFGVPAQLIGIKGDQTFSNFEQARLVFWEDTVIPYAKLIRNEINNWIFGVEQNEFFDFNLDNISALDIKREAVWKRIQDSNFISDNEKREATGYEEINAGKVLWKPAAQVPIEVDSNPSEDTDISVEEEEQRMMTLINEGFTEEEAREMMGLPIEEKPYANEHACRLINPDQFDSFRRQNNAAQSDGKQLDFIYGIKEGKSKLQAIRYPKKQWSASDAKAHCNARDHIAFEAAKDAD